MTTLKQTLSTYPFLAGLPEAHLSMLAAHASEARSQAGEYIFREGEVANAFYLIQQGKVALDTFVPQHGLVTIHTVSGQEILGWSWFIPPHRWRFNALTIEPTTAIVLDGAFLRERFEVDHDFGYELVKRLAVVIGQRFAATKTRLE